MRVRDSSKSHAHSGSPAVECHHATATLARKSILHRTVGPNALAILRLTAPSKSAGRRASYGVASVFTRGSARIVDNLVDTCVDEN